MSTKKTSKRKATKKAAAKKRATKKITRRKTTSKKAAKKRTAKKKTTKKASKKKATAKKPGRPRTPQAKLDAAVKAYATGKSVDEAAASVGIAERTLYRELTRLELLDEPAVGDLEPVDADALEEVTSLEGARRAVKMAFAHLHSLKAGHRGYPSALKAFGDSLARLRRWEREDAAEETPEQRERRLRLEAGEVVKKIENTVSAYEDEAREAGVCLWCGQPVPKELADELHGDAS